MLKVEMSPKATRKNDVPKLRMDSYLKKDQNNRSSGVLNTRREIDKVIKKARQDGDSQSVYWAKKVIEVEAKEPGRWHHTGYKKLYVDSDSSRSDNGYPRSKKSVTYSPSAPISPVESVRTSRNSITPDRRAKRRSMSSDAGRTSSRSRTDRFANSSRRKISRSPVHRTRSPVRRSSRSRSLVRRNKTAAARRPSLPRRSRLRSVSPRARKLSTKHVKSPKSRSGRRNSLSSRPKANRARNRSVDKISSSLRQRKKSPRALRYKDASKSTTPRRRSRPRSRSPVQTTGDKRKLVDQSRIRSSSSSLSPVASKTSHRKKKKKRTKSKRVISEVSSSLDCSDSNCSLCVFEKNLKEKKKKKTGRPKETKIISPAIESEIESSVALPRLPPPSSSRYARSGSFSAAEESTVVEKPRIELKRKKKKKERDLVLTKIKVEPPSEESDTPSPKRITLSDRFSKMAQSTRVRKVTESSHGNSIRVIAADTPRIEEVDVSTIEPLPEHHSLLLNESWDDVRIRYAYYKKQGYLEDLSFRDYLKWEEWWYGYQKWMENGRFQPLRRRL